jgi:predicted ATPase/DNA-binding SARP family transcriptional activator
VEFRVLGSLEVVEGNGPVEIQGAKERAVLAYLLVRLGRSVPSDEIIDAVWGERAPANAARSLQARISRLRRSLEAPMIARDGAGYRLAIDDGDVDSVLFERLVTEARDLEPSESLAKAEQALELLRGPPYGEFQYLDFAQAEIRRLKELELQAVELRLSALIELGRQTDALSDLERVVEQNPLREPLARLLMLALYRSGRHADALAAYRALTKRLRELGLSPDDESRRLERQILQRSPELEPLEAPRTNIGVRLTSVVGRDRDLAELLDRLAEQRLVTLTGPGGVGKTTLAVEAARRQCQAHSDGVWLVELASIREPTRIAEAVAEAIGTRTSEFEGQSVSGLGFLQRHLRRRELLLVLDNCEHVTAPVAELALALLSSCPGIRLLATSRERLGVPGEALVEVAPLAPDDAVRLFVERARSARADLDLDETTLAAITEVCSRLDGLPLALELAAARLRTLTPQEIAERLADRFALLGSAELLSGRRRTLASVLEWSYQLLSEDKQRLFRRLAIFPSSFGLDAAEEVCAGDGIDASQVADLLASLVDRSMVVASGRNGDRFLLLETLREFGRAQTTDEERLAVARRHARWATEIAEAGHARVWSEGLEAGTRAFVPRRADFEAGVDLAFELRDADIALSLAAALGTLGFLYAGGVDDRARVESALALPGGALETRLRCMRALGVLLVRDGHPSEAVRIGLSALGIAEEANDETEIAHTRTMTFQARLAAAERGVDPEELAPVADYAARKGEPWLEGIVHYYRGIAAFATGDIVEARNRTERALDAFAVSGDLWGIAGASEILGHSLAAVGEYDEAMRVYERALEAGIRDLRQAAVPMLYYYGLSRLRAGDVAGATDLFGECERLAARESPFLRWHSTMGAAHIALRREDSEEPEHLFGDALSLLREAFAEGLDNRGVRVAMAVTLRQLGELAERRGDGDEAERFQEEGLAWAGRLGEPRLIARALEGLAGAVALRGHAGAAARLLGVAEATRATVRGQLADAERGDVARISAALRERLGAERFAAEVEHGRAEHASRRHTIVRNTPVTGR